MVLDGLDTLEVLLDAGNLVLHPRCVMLKDASAMSGMKSWQSPRWRVGLLVSDPRWRVRLVGLFPPLEQAL
jgi:hypothetical protein